ncbi:hypothetical protein M569_07059 [Genlisea aurea]|uniref:Protein LNK2 n=1 Tax=Genlisea aurea TaxID=192259 RepID=S8CS72_9LAMI|nr:hypothetical protein M569_07059 [Genlisea aurea]
MFDWNDEEVCVILSLSDLPFLQFLDFSQKNFDLVFSGLLSVFSNSIHRGAVFLYSFMCQLTSIIWGVAGQSDDGVVQYPCQIEGGDTVLFEDQFKYQSNRQISDISSAQQKKSMYKSAFVDDLDTEQESLGEETSNLNKDPDELQRRTEDGGGAGFAGYGWEDIGNIDDLDKMFSDNDQLLEDAVARYADELWSSSKDVTGIPPELTSLPGDSSDVLLKSLWTSSENSEIEDHNLLDLSQSSASGYPKQNGIKYQDPLHVQASTRYFLNVMETFVTQGRFQGSHKPRNIGNDSPDKDSCQKGGRSKGQKSDRGNEVGGSLRDSKIPRTSLQQVMSQSVVSEVNLQPSSSSALPQQMSSQPIHFSGMPTAAPPRYGDIMSRHPVSVPPVYDSRMNLVMNNPSKNSQESSSGKPPRMTPKEKIEKLRRRQQMRAILAIQKQQQQFHDHQVSVSENSSFEKSGTTTAADWKNASSSFRRAPDPISPTEQDDDSRTHGSTVFDRRSVEESLLYRLQNTISKIDTRMRVCIRDSLFRLAETAIQRQNPSDTVSISSTSNVERFGCRVHRDVETETNPIDRTVARLLFHRPRELSGKLAESF